MNDTTTLFAVDINGISKSYGSKKVVDSVSFSILQGEIFGLIGPNGAGKTTSIRMMMDIIKPDAGSINILGNKLDENSKNKIGYLPEERGLYKKLTVIESLTYLASLKNCDTQTARKRAEELLKRMGMFEHRNKKVEELSKGMTQLVQIISTIIHNPDLIVLDEPFSGLDPINTELIKELIAELKKQGKTIILSTHQMNQVEELCDRIMMIDKGKNVLYGKLSDIKKKFMDNSVLIEFEGNLGNVKGVKNRRDYDGKVELFLNDEATAHDILEQVVAKGLKINRFEVTTPALNEIFIEVAAKGTDE
jgi:ABC-2 type transport system ATP-binding protein